jgi:hypothetical protein
MPSIPAGGLPRAQTTRVPHDSPAQCPIQSHRRYRHSHMYEVGCRSRRGIENPFPPPRSPQAQQQPPPAPSSAPSSTPLPPLSGPPSPSPRKVRKRQQLMQHPKWPSLSRKSTAIWDPQPASPPPPPVVPPPPPRSPRARSGGGGWGFGSPGGDPRLLLLLLAAIAASVLAITGSTLTPLGTPPKERQSPRSKAKDRSRPRGKRTSKQAEEVFRSTSSSTPRSVPVFRRPGELEKRMGYVLHMTEEEAKGGGSVRLMHAFCGMPASMRDGIISIRSVLE